MPVPFGITAVAQSPDGTGIIFNRGIYNPDDEEYQGVAAGADRLRLRSRRGRAFFLLFFTQYFQPLYRNHL